MIAFKTFRPPYTASSKQPGGCILPAGLDLPTIAVESGWSETASGLSQDRRLWLQGGAGEVHLVLIVKWVERANHRVSGTIEAYNLGQAGNENLLQTEVLLMSMTF